MPPLRAHVYGEGTVRLWEDPACVHGAAFETGPRFYVVGLFRRKLDNLKIIRSISTVKFNDGPPLLPVVTVVLWCVLLLIGMFLLICVCVLYSLLYPLSPPVLL